jgi:hypothetical protein
MRSLLPRDKCLTIMQEQRGIHVDPKVLDVSVARINGIVSGQIEYADLA